MLPVIGLQAAGQQATGPRVPGQVSTGPVASGLQLAVRLYQLILRPVLGPNCRFLPSCSDYAHEALARHGALRGSGLAIRRVLRCNPWCEGGHDPVPCASSPVQSESPAAH